MRTQTQGTDKIVREGIQDLKLQRSPPGVSGNQCRKLVKGKLSSKA